MNSEDLGYEPQTLDPDVARQRTEVISGQLHDRSGLKGTTTPDRSHISPYFGDYNQPFYLVRHVWSVYDLPVDQLRQGVQEIHDAIPAMGWKILKYGPDDTPARSLVLRAEQPEQRYALDITLVAGRSPGDAPSAPDYPIMNVFVVSQCYRLPKNVQIDSSYWLLH
jgi:hypothetical protein